MRTGTSHRDSVFPWFRDLYYGDLPKFGEKFYRPVVEIFAGIPSVVYGWVGLTVLIPAIKMCLTVRSVIPSWQRDWSLRRDDLPDDHECGG